MLASHMARSGASARLLLELAVEDGHSASDVLRGTGLSLSQLVETGREIQSMQEERLIQNIVGLVGAESDFAVRAGGEYRLEMFGMLGFACMSAPTHRNMLEISLRYQDLAFTLARARLIEGTNTTYIELSTSHLPPDVGRFSVDQCISTVLRRMAEMDAEPPPAHIEVSYPRPKTGDPFREVLGVAVVYGAAASQVGFPDYYLDHPRPQVDPAALALCERECRDIIERRHAQVGIAGFVRERLRRASGPLPSMDVIASDLFISVRALRRALAAEHSSFRALDEAVRIERSEALLTGTTESIERIAHALGYATAPAFVRAFKRSHGVSPGAWRSRAPRGD